MSAICSDRRTVVVDTGFDPVQATRRGRTLLRPVADGLRAIGVAPGRVDDVVLTHPHYDHVGNLGLFERADFHVQERELRFATGQPMTHPGHSAAYEVDDIAVLLRLIHAGRVRIHDGDREIAPGIGVHLVGGHTDGTQVVRVATRRGAVLLASDTAHFYANAERRSVFSARYDPGTLLDIYEHRFPEPAAGPDHMVPGHDPLVLVRYPAVTPALAGTAVRLDTPRWADHDFSVPNLPFTKHGALMLYEIATLQVKLFAVPKVLGPLESYTTGAPGRLLGCWETEHGEIFGRLLVLRGFADAAELAEERERLLTSTDPFGIGEHLDQFTVETYRMFPFLPEVSTGSYGAVYEFRTYHLRLGGLTPTMEGWRAAVPERTRMYPLTAAMYGLDGIPRITHIWPFPDLDSRLEIRKESYDRKIWPPENGPQNIAHATSTIGIPTPISPLH